MSKLLFMYKLCLYINNICIYTYILYIKVLILVNFCKIDLKSINFYIIVYLYITKVHFLRKDPRKNESCGGFLKKSEFN